MQSSRSFLGKSVRPQAKNQYCLPCKELCLTTKYSLFFFFSVFCSFKYLCCLRAKRSTPIYLCYRNTFPDGYFCGPALLSIHIKRCVTERNFLLVNISNGEWILLSWTPRKKQKLSLAMMCTCKWMRNSRSQIKLIMIMVRSLRTGIRE